MKIVPKILETDILIIGGGTAGCFSAITITETSEVKVIIAEKANIKRSGCLAAGVNALNAHINEGETPESFVEYVKSDSAGLIREDLVYTIAKRLNAVTKKIETMGLSILKNNDGSYVSRGRVNLKINGENIKPILAAEVARKKNVTVLNRVNITDYIIKDNKILGAYGFSNQDQVFYAIYAKAVICTTGGAAGLYKPNNPSTSKHKMWYSPFNVGSGYAMGMRAGAEMTTLEMRFIALRCKDTIAPTGTIAQGIGVKQINGRGEDYVQGYGKPTTPIRLYSTVQENRQGRGPCYLKTQGLDSVQETDLYKAYLNMAPSQTLSWLESGKGPAAQNVEIEGTEPYILGGHTASGYWVDTKRATTLTGLFAAGDVAGGSPHKFVTGCFAEGEIAALSALKYIQGKSLEHVAGEEIEASMSQACTFLENQEGLYSTNELEEGMQKVMDEYAGGIATGYEFNQTRLDLALVRINQLERLAEDLSAKTMHELLFIHELKDRLLVCKALIHHLKARKETRWPCFQQNADFPQRDDEHWLKYVNSIYEKGEFKLLFKNLIGRDEAYEHQN